MNTYLIIQLSLVMWVLNSWILELFNYIKLPKNKILSLVEWFVTCPKCFSFSTTLIYTKDFYTAASVSLIMWLIFDVLQNKTTKL